MSQVSIIGPTATNVIVKLDRITSLSQEYKFSNEFTFSNMIWKVACKEIRSNLSFLIYSMNKTLHRNRGFKIMIKIPARREGADVFVEARRHFGNKSTCFTWTCDKQAIHDHCVLGEVLILDVAIQIMADDKILSLVSHPALPDQPGDAAAADDADHSAAAPMLKAMGSLIGRTTEIYDWRASDLHTIGQEGKYSEEYAFGGQIWETSICKSGVIFAIKINCNREKRGFGISDWRVFARIQIIIRSGTGAPNAPSVEVEGKVFFLTFIALIAHFKKQQQNRCPLLFQSGGLDVLVL